MSDTLEVWEVRVVGGKEMRGPSKFRIFLALHRSNAIQGGEIIRLVLDHGKLKPPDIYRLLQEPTPDLRKPFLYLSLLQTTEPPQYCPNVRRYCSSWSLEDTSDHLLHHPTSHLERS